MKIDIGSNGKILGTKRVSANGQVSGFTEFAGREVLVILPGDETPVLQRDAHDIMVEVETVVQEQMRIAFREYKNLKAKFKTPQQATQQFLKQTSPKRLQGVIEKTDRWIKDQVGAVERRVQDGLKGARDRSKTGTSKTKR
jgi:ElaB/YqjD/DUF883 family membrane-anchored ribosome-binding protein